MAVDAIAEVQRLEAAIAAFGETNPHAKPLKVALQAAKSRSKVPPVADRIEVPKSLQGEWISDGATDLAKVPPMPSDLQDLEGWLSNRNCELRNALEHGDATSIAKLGTLLSQGAALLASITRRTCGRDVQVVQDVLIDRRCRFETQMFGECVIGVAIQSVESGVRNARYGLRGERVEEASHPGPPRCRDEDEALVNLEFALTMIDSDDDPLGDSSRGPARPRSTIEDKPSRFDSDDETVSRLSHIRPRPCQGSPQPTWPDSVDEMPGPLTGTPRMLVSCAHPDVAFSRHAVVTSNSSAPRKRLRIRMGRASQATAIVGVESSQSSSPEVVVEPAGSQAVGLSLGRFAVLAAEVDDDVSATVVAPSVQAVEVNEPEEVSIADTVISESPDLNVWENLERPFPARERDDDDVERMSTVSGSEEEPMPADGISVVSGEEEPTAPTEPELVVSELRDTSAVIRDAFRRLDDVDVEDIFRKRGFVMKSIPFCLRGLYRVALRVALTESVAADPVRRGRGWKLFLLLPRMLLSRRARGGLVSREKLRKRFEWFNDGRWEELIRESQAIADEANTAMLRRRRRRQPDESERRAARAHSMVQMGDLSRGRAVLEAAELAPGTNETLEALEHLRPLLDNPRDVHSLFLMAEQLAQGLAPEAAVRALRLDRLTALRKPTGGVRGIVVGDILRRLVSRTIAQQLNDVVKNATSPFQYALSTRAGCECIAHALQALCEQDPNATILSVDGIGAFDLVSRGATLHCRGFTMCLRLQSHSCANFMGHRRGICGRTMEG